jgi:hypothetical protein
VERPFVDETLLLEKVFLLMLAAGAANGLPNIIRA